MESFKPNTSTPVHMPRSALSGRTEGLRRDGEVCILKATVSDNYTTTPHNKATSIAKFSANFLIFETRRTVHGQLVASLSVRAARTSFQNWATRREETSQLKRPGLKFSAERPIYQRVRWRRRYHLQSPGRGRMEQVGVLVSLSASARSTKTNVTLLSSSLFHTWRTFNLGSKSSHVKHDIYISNIVLRSPHSPIKTFISHHCREPKFFKLFSVQSKSLRSGLLPLLHHGWRLRRRFGWLLLPLLPLWRDGQFHVWWHGRLRRQLWLHVRRYGRYGRHVRRGHGPTRHDGRRSQRSQQLDEQFQPKHTGNFSNH